MARSEASPTERIQYSVPELAAAVAAVTIAIWIVSTTVLVIRAGYSPLPFWDEWDRWRRYLSHHYGPAGFFLQHNEHRLAVPGVLFAIDHLLFAGRDLFLLACTFCLQGLLGVMLWRLSWRARRQDRAGVVVLGCAIVSCLYSAQQYFNFIGGFQVQFPLLYCAAVAALFALWKGREAQQRLEPGGLWLAASMGLAVAGTYSMANGILIWPVLLLTALWSGMRRSSGAIAVAGALVGMAYFHGWHRVNEPSHPFASLAAAGRVATFWLVHLGSPAVPLASLSGNGTFAMACAAIFGGLLLLALAAEFISLWLFRDRHNGAQAVVIHMGVFLAASSLVMAVGRSGMMALSEAATSRYLTPAYIFLLCVLIAAWPLGRRLSPGILYWATCAALLAGIAIHQMSALRTVRDREANFHLGEVAVVNGVVDPAAWIQVYHTAQLALPAVDYLREHRLAIFAEEWTHWPGIALNRRFSIDRNPNACQGGFEETMAVPSPLKGGWRVSGWAWDVKEGRPPQYVILGDDAGQVAGVALTGFPEEPELAALSAKHTASPWTGYVSGEPRTVTAYVLESDQRSLCAIGSRMVRPLGGEVGFAWVGDAFGAAPEQVTGSWTKDGYFPQTGRPPVDGEVLGSWSGSDGNTGTMQWGPIHLDGRTRLVLPLVTGPASHGLSVRIRNAASKETLAELVPPPARMDWWAWLPELPAGQEMDIEIVAEDKGRGFGEWQAIGWPHAALESPRHPRNMPAANGSSGTLTLSKLECACFLDYIGPVVNPAGQNSVEVAADQGVTFSGWAIDELHKAAAGGVDVVIDGMPYSARYGVERGDVAGHYNNAALRNTGFEWTLAPGQLSKGLHSVSLRVIASDRKTYYQGPGIQFRVR